MNEQLGIPVALTPDFALHLSQQEDRWTARCSGVLDIQNASASIQPQLLRLHQAALEHKVQAIRLELQRVEYMNSSGLKGFVAWFLKANEVEKPYVIEVVYDPASTWQGVSLEPLGRLAPRALKLIGAAP